MRPRLGEERGVTMVELLIAATMSVLVVAAATSMLVSAVRKQPDISERSQAVSTVRWVLERMTREIRNGVKVEDGSDASTLVLVTRLRRSVCGGSPEASSDAPARECRVVYSCTASGSGGHCSRLETEPEGEAGTWRPIIEGIDDPEVFHYHSASNGPTDYVGITFRIPNPTGPGALSITDGASLRSLTLQG